MENFKREIFEQLGNLFYALAEDQHVSAISSGELKMLLRKDWLTETDHHSDDRVSEAAHLIGLTIDTLEAGKVPAGEAYGNFRRFYTQHREQFSYALKLKIIEATEAICGTFPSAEKGRHLMDDVQALLSLSNESKELQDRAE